MSQTVRLLCLFAAALALAGCATGFKLENNVQSFSQLAAVPAPATYRFERLPSQAADPVQSQIEALADPALHKAGFRRDDSQPRYSIEVSARVERMLSPYADPWDRFGFGWGLGGRRWGLSGSLGRMESPWYRREVGIVVRELAGNRVVYETRAASDGPWHDNATVLPAMFDAALQGFPQPPQGLRRVEISIGAKQEPGAPR